MAELIEHCMYESGLTADGCWNELDDYAKDAIERFAVLIVRECCNIVKDEVQYISDFDKADAVVNEVKEHFGV